MNIIILESQKPNFESLKNSVLSFVPNALFTHASNEVEFRQKIHWLSFDVVLANFQLPGCKGLDALLFVKNNFPNLPFIFVNGTPDSEVAAARAVLNGASAYVEREDFNQLRDQIFVALKRAKDNLDRYKAQQRSNNQYKLTIQHLMELIKDSTDFGQREKVLELLNQIYADKTYVYGNYAVPQTIDAGGTF
jgi:DNA-binding NtrC family response regulator